MSVKNINFTLAENIFNLRKKKGVSQAELAESLGVTYQAVSKWETAKSAPDISLLPALAEALDCNINELFAKAPKSQNGKI